MIISKNNIILAAYSKLRISGLTVSPSPEDTELALNRLTALVAALPFDIGYNYPLEYGTDDPNDDSEITIDALDPLASILAYSLSIDFGKPFNEMVKINAESTLARNYVIIEPSKYPVTLPVGAGNSYEGTAYRIFYDGHEPIDNADEVEILP